jgi:hypothetical protein
LRGARRGGSGKFPAQAGADAVQRGKDVPGNIMLEQAVRAEMQKAARTGLSFRANISTPAIFRTRSIFACFKITSAKNMPGKIWI